MLSGFLRTVGEALSGVQTTVTYGSKIHLKTVDTNKYVCSEGSHKMLVCDRDAASIWETFTIGSKMKPNGSPVQFNDAVYLIDHHGKYVCAESNEEVWGNRDSAAEWETFYLVDPLNLSSFGLVTNVSKVAFRNHRNNFVSNAGGYLRSYPHTNQSNMFVLTLQGTPSSVSTSSHHIYPQTHVGVHHHVHSPPSHSIPQAYYVPPQPQVHIIQSSSIPQAYYVPPNQTCLKCQGKGAFDPWGPCEVNSIHKKYMCPVCGGAKFSGKRSICTTCQGRGGMGPFGACELYDVHKRSLCHTCNGQCYF